MEPSSDLDVVSIVKDAFEIKERHRPGHEPGLVTVLDRLLVQKASVLCGLHALIRTTDGRKFRHKIDGAKNHGAANSLFFKNLTLADVPIGSQVEVLDETDGKRHQESLGERKGANIN